MTTIHADRARIDRVYDPNQSQQLTRIVHQDDRETVVSAIDNGGVEVTSPNAGHTRFRDYQRGWHMPTSIVSPAGSTELTWNMMNLVSELVSSDADGLLAHNIEYNWAPDDAGRLTELRVDNERVFPE